jgi:putative MATE family efflux protein
VLTETKDGSSPSRSLWGEVREAIAGSQQDFTQGSLGRAILLLAVPMVLEMSMESLFGVVDMYWVARLGPDAVAAVTISESLLTLVFAVALGLSMSTTAMVARRIGEKNPEAAAVAAVQAILIGLAVSAAVGVAGAVWARPLLRLMGAAPAVVAGGWAYTAIVLGGSVTILLLFLINAVFRGAGDAAIAMRTLWFANLVNIVLDPCFIYGWGPFPEMGLPGAAVATTIGRGLGVCYQLWVLFSGRGRVVVRRADVRLEPVVLWRLFRISLTGMFQFFISTASWLGLVRIIAVFGSAALAGYGVAIRIIIFSILPSWGLSNAAATLVGQNLGARQPDRAERSVWTTGFYNMVFLGLLALVFIVVPGPLVRIFTSDPAVVSVGVDCLRYISYGYVFYAYGMVMVQAFNGAGDTFTPTVINLFCYWLWEIPLAYVLARWTGLGVTGVFLAIAIAESTTALVGILAFRRGRWKKHEI